ncbi:DUF4012 domain-containing protein [Demequina iriomotensis]|uniref:DUF4012 domain-containing protein n=1 Tax=Demequina iriomotensis TaxID=1536641 RepID=UPI000782ADA5|nr:DUF4012 domain-containing protein [Demequina iriomotensis]
MADPDDDEDGAPRDRRRIWPWAVTALAIAIIAWAGALAWDALQLAGAARDVKQQASAAQAALKERDAATLSAEVEALQRSAATLAAATDGPHWWIATHLPWVKNQAIPVVAVGEAATVLADDVLDPLSDQAVIDALEVPGFENGRIDPDIFAAAQAPMTQADDALAAQIDALAALDLSRTDQLISERIIDLRDQLREVGDLVHGGRVAAELLPPMLGGEGARTYLVMVQNNAEPRAIGGIPGAILELKVDEGRMDLGEYVAASNLVDRDGVGGLTADEQRIFTDRMQVYPQDVTFTPEYPRAAQMLTRFWQADGRDPVDGVVSVDPVALGWMLDGAPPIEVGDFTLRSGNAARVLLNETYLKYPDPKDQDAFFADASAALFDAVASGKATALGGVERAIEAGRLLVWSADADEQRKLADTGIAGAFLEQDDALGLFVNDGSGAKIAWYIDTDTTVTDHLCTDGSLAGQTVEVTFTHTFDGDVDALPSWVKGTEITVPAGRFAANVLLYPAAGTFVAAVRHDGEAAAMNPEVHDGRSVVEMWLNIGPGESTTLDFDIDTTATGLLRPLFEATPGPKPNVYTAAKDGNSDKC